MTRVSLSLSLLQLKVMMAVQVDAAVSVPLVFKW